MLAALIPAALQALGSMANSPAASAPPTTSGSGAFTPVFTVGPKIVGRDNSAPQSVSPIVTNTPRNAGDTQPGFFDSPAGVSMPAIAPTGSGLLAGIPTAALVAIGAAVLGLLAVLFWPSGKRKAAA